MSATLVVVENVREVSHEMFPTEWTPATSRPPPPVTPTSSVQCTWTLRERRVDGTLTRRTSACAATEGLRSIQGAVVQGARDGAAFPSGNEAIPVQPRAHSTCPAVNS